MEPLVKSKPKFDRAQAIEVAKIVFGRLKPACERIAVAGSLRRGRPRVGDVEIVFIARWEERRAEGDLFASERVNLADQAILEMEREGILGRRVNVRGYEVYGPKNKLMWHVGTRVPVDLFATDHECWWNYLVCRTGPAESNARIATMAQRIGCRWHPYGKGFTDEQENWHRMASEEDVFRFVGLPYREPWNR